MMKVGYDLLFTGLFGLLLWASIERQRQADLELRGKRAIVHGQDTVILINIDDRLYKRYNCRYRDKLGVWHDVQFYSWEFKLIP